MINNVNRFIEKQLGQLTDQNNYNQELFHKSQIYYTGYINDIKFISLIF